VAWIRSCPITWLRLAVATLMFGASAVRASEPDVDVGSRPPSQSDSRQNNVGTARGARNHSTDMALVSELAAMWEAHRTSIQTSSIAYRWISVPSSGKRTRHEAKAIVASIDLVERPDEIRTLAERFLGQAPEGRGWTTAKLVTEGNRIRLELDGGDSEPVEILVSDSEREIIRRGVPHQQTDVFVAGASGRYIHSVSDLWTIPHLVGQDQVVLTRRMEGRVTLTFGRYEVTADEATAAVFEMSDRDPDIGILADVMQAGFVICPGDVFFPRSRIHVRYGPDGIVSSVEAFVVESAQFNHPISDGAFTIATTTQDVPVYDYRGDRNRPQWHHLNSPTADVLKEVEARTAPIAPRSRASVVVAIASILLIVLLVLSIRYRRVVQDHGKGERSLLP
jgi:hypothetical protein